MNRTCIFDQNFRCPVRLDYDVTLCALEETEELCRGNWIEIMRLRRWTDALTAILDAHGIPYPSEWDVEDDGDDDIPCSVSGSGS